MTVQELYKLLNDLMVDGKGNLPVKVGSVDTIDPIESAQVISSDVIGQYLLLDGKVG